MCVLQTASVHSLPTIASTRSYKAFIMYKEIIIEEANKAFNKSHVTSSATDNNWRKCKHCGKFISYKQMEEQKDVMFHFIPDTDFTTEEAYWVHKNCW